jgi:flagellar basal-body rod protein FlgF
MQSGLYVTLSAEVALEKRLTTVASNVANMNTAGYRADGVSFASLLSQTDNPVAFVSSGDTYVSRRTGDVTRTDNPLDVAVQGDAWLGIQTPQGPGYTRDGRMRILASGDLQTLNGNPVLDAGGASIVLDPSAGTPQIAGDGMITQGGRQVGALGLFNIDPTASLTRAANSAVIPDKPATVVLDFASNGVTQGFVEGSNVDPVAEMAKLIMIQRTFDSVSSMNQENEASLNDAIKTLGSSS